MQSIRYDRRIFHQQYIWMTFFRDDVTKNVRMAWVAAVPRIKESPRDKTRIHLTLYRSNNSAYIWCNGVSPEEEDSESESDFYMNSNKEFQFNTLHHIYSNPLFKGIWNMCTYSCSRCHCCSEMSVERYHIHPPTTPRQLLLQSNDKRQENDKIPFIFLLQFSTKYVPNIWFITYLIFTCCSSDNKISFSYFSKCFSFGSLC